MLFPVFAPDSELVPREPCLIFMYFFKVISVNFHHANIFPDVILFTTTAAFYLTSHATAFWRCNWLKRWCKTCICKISLINAYNLSHIGYTVQKFVYQVTFSGSTLNKIPFCYYIHCKQYLKFWIEMPDTPEIGHCDYVTFSNSS